MKSLMEYGQVKLEKKYYIDLENYYKTIGKLTSFYNYIAQLAKDDDNVKLSGFADGLNQDMETVLLVDFCG